MRGRCTFKACDVERAIKAVTKAGLSVACVKIDREGTIIIETTQAVENDNGNDLDKWLADHARPS